MTSNQRVPNLRLRVLLSEAGWTQESLARAVNAVAADQGVRTRYDRKSVAHWLSGSQPRPPVPEFVTEAFARRLRRAVTVLDTGMARGGDPPGPSGAWAALPIGELSARLAEMARAEIDPVHRAVVRTLPFRPATIHLPWADPDREGTPPAVPGSDNRTRAMRQVAQVLAFHIEAFGGGHARSTLAAYLAEDVSHWLRQSGTDRRGLLVGAAQLTHLLALAVGDMGAEGQAQGYHQTAIHLAAEAGDRTTYSICVRALSTQTLRLGHRELSERLARSALRTAGPDVSPAVQAYLQAQLAVSLARTRRRKAALASLTAAEQNMSRQAPGEGPFTRYPLADFTYQKAMALTALGDRTAAIRALHDSLGQRDPARSRSRALTSARLAEMYPASGDLNAASAHWHTVLDKAGQLHSQQVGLRLHPMRLALQPYRSSAAARSPLTRSAHTTRMA